MDKEFEQKEVLLRKSLKKAPEWAQSLYELVKYGFTNIRSEITKVGESINFSDEKIRELEAKQTKQDEKIKTLETSVKVLKTENDKMFSRMVYMESQSRRVNLLLLNVKEESDETPEKLRKMAMKLFSDMKLGENDEDDENEESDDENSTDYDIRIERIHRKKGPERKGFNKPIIIKFQTYSMRELVWKHRFNIRDIDYAKKWFLADDFPAEIESKRRIMYPIVKAAKAANHKAFINVDKLNFDSKVYTINTLNTLPKQFRPEYLSTKCENGYTCFFSRSSPCSNHYMATFVVDGKTYTSMEQYIMEGKALIFKDLEKAREIMAALDPVVQKNLGREVKGFNQQEWEEKAPDMVKKGLLKKFTSSDFLKEFLLETEDTILVECNAYDKLFSCGLSLTNPDKTDESKWDGKNWLGKFLGEVRTQLQQS